MARCDLQDLELARARVRLAAGHAPSRTSARRFGAVPSFAGVDRAVLLAASDPDRRARAVDRAVAAAHGDEIACAIDGTSRAAILDAVGAEARAFGLARRDLACAVTDARPLAERLESTRREVDAVLTAHLDGAPLEGALGACLAAALEGAE